MTREDFLHLQSSNSKQLVECYLKQSSMSVALKIRDAAVCNQIKYLDRAQEKLPSFFAARCIISSITYEQSSSEAAAFSKFSDMPCGELAIDLTCGLGVDSYALSKRFKRVIALEINELRADILRYNMAFLGVTNIEVLNMSAEKFCAQNPMTRADLVYVDPSRMTNVNQKIYSLKDSQPDVVQLLPYLSKMACVIIIKLSPMFDIEECFKVFSTMAMVEVVSIKNECKEVLVKLGCTDKNSIKNTILQNNRSVSYSFKHDESVVGKQLDMEPVFLHIPDVCFYKTRTVTNYLSVCYPAIQFDFQNYIFTTHLLPMFDGQSFKIGIRCPYQPKNIKKILKDRGIKRAVIHHRNFPYSTSDIVRSLGIREGGTEHLIFTIYNAVPTLFLVTLHKMEK